VIFFFSVRPPRAEATKAKIAEGSYIKLKLLCTVMEIITEVKRQPTVSKKITMSYIYHEGLISRMYKEFKQLNSKQTKQSN
jgi:hypothetical protein